MEEMKHSHEHHHECHCEDSHEHHHDIIMIAHAAQKNMSTRGAVATTIIMKKAV